MIFTPISTIIAMSSKRSIYPKHCTQALGEHNHTKEKTFSFQDGQDGRLPGSELSQSCGLHFWVLSGQGSWSQRLLSSSASPVLVLMHLTWRRWMPPPQGAVHWGSGAAPSARGGWGTRPHAPHCRPPAPRYTGSTGTREVFIAVAPSLVLRVGFSPPFLAFRAQALSGGAARPRSPLPRSPPPRWCRGGCCRAGWCWAVTFPRSGPAPGMSPAAPAPRRRTTPSTVGTRAMERGSQRCKGKADILHTLVS